MLYCYSDHIKDLAKDPQKKKELEKYILYYGRQDNLDIYDTTFFKEYLDKFEIPFFLAYPEDLDGDFDWNLLVKMVAGSFSSEYDLMLDEEWKDNPKGVPRVHIYITVKSGEQTITKDIEELWSFQIIRLFEIYAEEQINLFSLMAEEKKDMIEDWASDDQDEEDEDSVGYQQKIRLADFQEKADLMMKEARSAFKLHACL